MWYIYFKLKIKDSNGFSIYSNMDQFHFLTVKDNNLFFNNSSFRGKSCFAVPIPENNFFRKF